MKTRVRKALCGVAAAALVMAVTAACASQTEKAASTPSPVDTTIEQETPIGMPNPASVYCLEQSGRLEMREDAAGTSGYCVFPDGTEKEEWDFWRENHPVDEVPVIDPDRPVGLANPASVYCIEQDGELETRTDADDNQTGICMLPDGSEKNQWDFWRENHPAQAAAGSIADHARPIEAPSGTPQIVRQVSAEESEEIARKFVLDSPTYRFDGIEGSLTLVERFDAFCPYCWGYVFKYKSAHPGYGDRSGQVLAQVITVHEILVSTSGGAVDGATVDWRWDVVAQSPIKVPVVVTAVAPAPIVPATGDEVGAVMSEEESEKLARGFVRDSRTFESDGNEESLKLVETLQARCPGCWAFVYTFDSRHAGYGDRSDQMLAQVITPHQASIVIEQGKVVKAILDDEWDMMAQEMVQ